MSCGGLLSLRNENAVAFVDLCVRVFLSTSILLLFFSLLAASILWNLISMVLRNALPVLFLLGARFPFAILYQLQSLQEPRSRHHCRPDPWSWSTINYRALSLVFLLSLRGIFQHSGLCTLWDNVREQCCIFVCSQYCQNCSPTFHRFSVCIRLMPLLWASCAPLHHRIAPLHVTLSSWRLLS